MQSKVINLDGSLKGLEELGGSATPQDRVNDAVNTSGSGPGYTVILGERLDADNPTEQVFMAVARQGELLCQNLFLVE